MACVDLTYISNEECIGNSLSSINGNFAALSSAVCNFNVVDGPTIDLDWNASTRTLSASVSSINSFFTGVGVQSLSSNGYQKLPGGLIIQWGIVSINYNQTINGPFNYPISFTSSPYTFVASPSSNNVAIDGAIVPYSTSLNSNNFSIYGDYTMSTYTRQTYWLAIGY